MSDFGLEPIKNSDIVDVSAPWASTPDEESDDDRDSKPMAVPDDESSSDESVQEPKGTVMPFSSFLTVSVLASVAGATVVSAPPPVEPVIPPTFAMTSNAPIAGAPPNLSDMP